jgi:molecular chaperone GrpE
MEEKDLTQNADNNMNDTLNTDENAAGTTHLNEPVAEESATGKLQAELEEQKNKYLRLYADFDNHKRRTAKEILEIRQTAAKDVIIPLLEVLDDCDRAEKQIRNTDDIQQITEGIGLVFSKLRKTLQARGVEVMESVNKDFDTELHEAITEIDVPEEKKGKVVDEVQKGYTLNSKIIRFAKVVVGK